ncbi:hypothetical protein QAD02_001790 [Eretmocerus hayati]|uniref:Uncharacterized protein n=1 Tax=Eretmocerus hayati TaxID=131215 RepID=A0ACC2NHZ3_9HYME|nr:hypothetical protein QAD02_001790 [Eretmocerus hayati]
MMMPTNGAAEGGSGANGAPKLYTDQDVDGWKPESALAASIGETYTLTGITLNELVEKHGGLEFEYDELMQEFKKHIPDFGGDITPNAKSIQFEYCSKFNLMLLRRKGKSSPVAGMPFINLGLQLTMYLTALQLVHIKAKMPIM